MEPDDPPYTVTCPRTGWRVPMLDTRQVSERHGAILELAPIPADRSYAIEFRTGVDDDEWDAAEQGTVVRADGELFLVHDPGDGEVRVRIANRAKAYLYCVEVEDPNTGWRVPLAPSWVISKNYRTVARLVPDHANRRFEIEVEEDVVTKLSKRPHAAPFSMATSTSRSTASRIRRRWSACAARCGSGAATATPRRRRATGSGSSPAATATATPPPTTFARGS